MRNNGYTPEQLVQMGDQLAHLLAERNLALTTHLVDSPLGVTSYELASLMNAADKAEAEGTAQAITSKELFPQPSQQLSIARLLAAMELLGYRIEPPKPGSSLPAPKSRELAA